VSLSLIEHTSKLFSPMRREFVVERYAIALTSAVLAIVVRWLLDPVLGHVAFYVTVYAAVAFCALVCGYLPAIVCSLAGFLGVFYWFVDPRYSLSIEAPSEIHSVTGFFLVCATLIALGETNRRKQLRLNRTIVALTSEADQRKRVESELHEAHDELERRVDQRTEQLAKALSKLESEIEIRQCAEESLRQLSVRLMTLQDEERRRIARDLHDTAGQTLSAIKMISATIEQVAADTPHILRLLGELNAFADEALQEIRTTSYLLHPPLLDEAGIGSAAQWFVEGFAKRSGIQAEVEIAKEFGRLPRNYELVLFRVLQESLTNVHRHSGASAAAVKLGLENGRIELEISDNGNGISAEQMKRLSETAAANGVGLIGMRERVHELGGWLEIRSASDGTVISVALPLQKTEGTPEASRSTFSAA
jgi:signal transduction histidine kinase